MAVKVTDAQGNTVNIAGRGLPGVPGHDGKSAYQYAVDGGYTGTEEEFQVLIGSGPWVPEAGFVPASNPNILYKHYVRGHYSRDGGMDRGGYSSRRDNRGRYSRDDGRSEMMEHLEMAMETANEQDRDNIKRWMRQLENA